MGVGEGGTGKMKVSHTCCQLIHLAGRPQGETQSTRLDARNETGCPQQISRYGRGLKRQF